MRAAAWKKVPGLNILFSSAGRRVELLHCFRNAARELDIPLVALGADLRPSLSAACAAADRSFAAPRCTAPEFIPEMLRICSSERVKLLIPTIDTELEVFAAHREQFAAIGTTVSVSSPEVIAICRDKLQTTRFLNGIGVVTPRTSMLREVMDHPGAWKFPLISKPIGGSSSVGLAVVKSAAELASQPVEGQIVQERWGGTEYTVNIFFDREKLISAVPHRRIEVRAGEVSKGRTERVPVLVEYARKLGEAWRGRAFGALCFQAIVNESGAAAVFEINGRFGGGYPLAHQAGASFAKWLLEMVAGRTVSATGDWRENVLMLRYDAAIFREDSGV